MKISAHEEYGLRCLVQLARADVAGESLTLNQIADREGLSVANAGTLMWITDFSVTLRDASGTRRTFARDGDAPKVEVKDPLQWHLDHLRTLTDKDMHDLTAYLVTLK